MGKESREFANANDDPNFDQMYSMADLEQILGIKYESTIPEPQPQPKQIHQQQYLTVGNHKGRPSSKHGGGMGSRQSSRERHESGGKVKSSASQHYLHTEQHYSSKPSQKKIINSVSLQNLDASHQGIDDDHITSKYSSKIGMPSKLGHKPPTPSLQATRISKTGGMTAKKIAAAKKPAIASI